MDAEKVPKPIDQQPELPKGEKPVKSPIVDSEEPGSGGVEAGRAEANKQDDAKIAEIGVSHDLERPLEQNDTKQYLQEHLGLKEGAVERVGLLKAKDLPTKYKAQREALHDERLDGVTIAVVPDDLWDKGNQPSESSAEKQLILIKQSYFEARGNPDEIAWLCHELAHCQNFLDFESPESYRGNMQKFAFEDIAQYASISRTDLEHELSQIESHGGDKQAIEDMKKLLKSTDEDVIKMPVYYPNNPVERYTFTKQFQYLKDQSKSREDVLAMISEHYDKKDFPFFNRLLDNVYGK
ncbi:MAG TPA: hypothetical protein VMX18_03710 [Candidatus Bipolaricaulota bacterium]|nr:hypothetical protein [Candidatus Bipolaricaulota bacterium]